MEVIIEGKTVTKCAECPFFSVSGGYNNHCVESGFDIADSEIIDEDCLYLSEEEEDEEFEEEEFDYEDDGPWEES